MKKQKGFTLIEVLVVLTFLIIAAGGVVVWEKKVIPTPTPTTIDSQVQKIDDECEIDADCEYIWFAGSCHTPEYVKTVQDRAKETGMRLGEALRREGVVCECQNNRCIEKEKLVYKEDVSQFCGLEGLRKLSLRDFPVIKIDKCGSLYRLFRECCDAQDIILDENFNVVAKCGGFGAYSEECTKIVSHEFSHGCTEVVKCKL